MDMNRADRRDIDVEAFYTRYGPMVLRRCRAMLRDEQAAFDAMQEVFLKVLTHRKRLTGDYPSALLYRMATNICLNRIRDDRKHETGACLDLLQNLSSKESARSGQSAKILFDEILSLEKKSNREIAVMYFLDGMTLKEISAAVKLSVSGVHKRLEKLRRKIRATGEA
jgi:RNA polymerase sigma-70 factor (ECF subfamily)